MNVKRFAKLILSVIEDETEKYGDGYALASVVSLCEKQIETNGETNVDTKENIRTNKKQTA